jgi:hypothetical protein
LPQARALRVRTITAGVGLRNPAELQRVETAIATLERARRIFEDEDYEVQTLRILRARDLRYERPDGPALDSKHQLG